MLKVNSIHDGCSMWNHCTVHQFNTKCVNKANSGTVSTGFLNTWTTANCTAKGHT